MSLGLYAKICNFFNMQRSSTELLRVVKCADMVLTTFGMSN